MAAAGLQPAAGLQIRRRLPIDYQSAPQSSRAATKTSARGLHPREPLLQLRNGWLPARRADSKSAADWKSAPQGAPQIRRAPQRSERIVVQAFSETPLGKRGPAGQQGRAGSHRQKFCRIGPSVVQGGGQQSADGRANPRGSRQTTENAAHSPRGPEE